MAFPAGRCPDCPDALRLDISGPLWLKVSRWECKTRGRSVRIIWPDSSRALTFRGSVTPLVEEFIDIEAAPGSGAEAWPVRRASVRRIVAAAGVQESDAVVFDSFRFTGAEVAMLHRHGVTGLAVMQQWHKVVERVGLAQTRQWLALPRPDPVDALSWTYMRVSAKDSITYRSREEYRFLAAGQLPNETAWAALRGQVSAPFAGCGYRQGRTPNEVVQLAEVLVPKFATLDPDLPLTWANPYSESGRERSAVLEEVAERAAGVDWNDFTICLEVGMSTGEAIAFLTGGGDMGPVRLLHALQADPPG